ncbi:DUF2189 domain-containing protein [Azoarcus sp. TTM-91]|uniref:DUF2189 domain-containing protein n=1 Tax=Azoarcus sp. TTM-91 TaxID=2691581 RepID=UPI00145DEEC1|nr:DUF2189 domain-containing protein [Azoarcus sp. TTM-91]NMG37205.1 DUF2189 domain-containing protein [Azoarcus sp. TTM-91]
MDKPYPSSLDHHFQLPQVRQVATSRPLLWLRLGLQDMRDSPSASLSYGAILAAIGYMILAYAASMPYLFTAAISGFFLIGPLAAAGLYEISRRQDGGERVSFSRSLKGLARHGDSLLYFGVFLALVLIGWERISAILFALFYHDVVPDLGDFYRTVFFSGEYTHFVVSYLVVGGALAAVVYALSAIAIPMLMDREVDAITAAMTSARAVGVNLGAMALWAVITVAMVAIGFATMMIGLVLLLPLLGHATWHAYKDMVG